MAVIDSFTLQERLIDYLKRHVDAYKEAIALRSAEPKTLHPWERYFRIDMEKALSLCNVFKKCFDEAHMDSLQKLSTDARETSKIEGFIHMHPQGPRNQHFFVVSSPTRELEEGEEMPEPYNVTQEQYEILDYIRRSS